MADQVPGQLVLLAGAGSTWKLAEPLRHFFGDAFIGPDWIEPTSRAEPLSGYVQRWAEVIRPKLDSQQPLFLSGSSLGGVMAQEMAQVLRPRALLLISTTRTYRAMRMQIRGGARLESSMPLTVNRMLLRLRWPTSSGFQADPG